MIGVLQAVVSQWLCCYRTVSDNGCDATGC
jgi:DNA-binding transcriptional regulator YdaS (Cro superfamily)